MKNHKEVIFNAWCRICKHYNKKENEEPCEECLSEPTNLHSEKPVKYERSHTKEQNK